MPDFQERAQARNGQTSDRIIKEGDSRPLLKLKRVEIHGFKSFFDRTEMRFHGSGVAAVVGPNGCGKSNLSDAISWVLGEQSAKTLRGARMEDVIFAGTRDRKPLGMASVTITLIDPASDKLPKTMLPALAGDAQVPDSREGVPAEAVQPESPLPAQALALELALEPASVASFPTVGRIAVRPRERC